jgi:arsenite methyltransferase
MKMRIPAVLLIWLPAMALAQNASAPRSKEEIQKIHQDPKAYIAMLENPQRDAEQKPDEVLRALKLKEGASIADIGAGSGYFSLRFAQSVGAGGRVYAVDINSDMILYMNRRIRDAKLKNVVTVLSDPGDPLLQDNSIDMFFVCNTWHHVSDKPGYLALMKKMLRPGGRIVIVDYKKEALPVGPPPEMKLARDEVLKEMQAAGFKLAAEHSFLPYQYFLEFK